MLLSGGWGSPADMVQCPNKDPETSRETGSQGSQNTGFTQFMKVNHSMKTVCKVKIRKSNMIFPLLHT
jgi:hypothetical protein